jgi:Spy/CpxP family protein refolding chaperone
MSGKLKRIAGMILGTAAVMAMLLALVATPAGARGQAAGTQGSEGMAKLQAIAKQLNLTPQQKEKLMPILIADAPKLKAIKENTSLTGMQKLQQLRAVHQASDPQIHAILTPPQYEQWQAIRKQQVEEAMAKK